MREGERVREERSAEREVPKAMEKTKRAVGKKEGGPSK